MTEQNEFEVNDNTYSIINNPLLQDGTVIRQAIDSIQDTLSTLGTYTPAEVDTFSDWSYDAGDIVTLVKDGADYIMPIFQNVLNWNGASDITWQSSGNEERELPTVQERQSYGTGTAVAAVEDEVAAAEYEFHTYMDQTDTYIRLIATETDVAAAQEVGKSLFEITSGQIQSMVVQTGVTSSLPVFDPEETYASGDQVAYNGAWYEFTAAHSGPWTGADVTAIQSQQSQITQNSTGILSLVTKTGVNSLGQNETLFSRISQTEDAISLVVTSTTGESGTTHSINTAGIILAINGGTGHSDVSIEADVITLNGSSIVATGQFEATALYTPELDCTSFYQGGQGGKFSVNSEAYFYGLVHLANNGGTVWVGDDDLESGTIVSPNGAFGSLSIGIGEGQTSYSLTTTNVPGMVTDLWLDGPTNNVYTLKKKTVANPSWDNVGTFSRATELGGQWGSGTGVLTVTATPQGNQYVSNHYLSFDGDGQHSDFSVKLHSQDTGEQSPTQRMSMYGYLVLSGSEENAKVVVGPNANGSNYVGVLPVGSLYTNGHNDGYAEGHTDGYSDGYADGYADAGGGGGNIVYRVPVNAYVDSAFMPASYSYEWIAVEYRTGGASYKGFMKAEYIAGTNAYNGSGTVNPGCQGGYTSIPSSMVFSYSVQVRASSGSTVNLRSSPNT